MSRGISIEELLVETQKIEKWILEHEEPIGLKLFFEWRENRQKIGECLADAAFGAIADKYDAHILSNPVNPSSYAHFIRSDVQSKTFTILSRTIREGMRSGFLESEDKGRMRLLDFWVGGQQFYAVQRMGAECLVKEPAASDIPLTVACYEDNSLIISDIDLVSIFLKQNSKTSHFDPAFGELTAEEKALVQDLNRTFQELVSTYFDSSAFRLIAHGASTRFSNAKTAWLNRSMKLHSPCSSVKWLDGLDAFYAFNREMDNLGYYVHLNPNWEF
jgi:hypothetical protein